jgi:putative glutamine amidotransferase
MRPLIGITGAIEAKADRPPRFRINQAYARAIELAGGVPVLIPSFGPTETLRATFEALAGIVLPGGADLQPSTYGAERHVETDEGNAILDETELALARWALEEGKPVLGICRGQQCLNVAAGGTLYQHIPDDIPQALVHRYEVRTGIAHTIEVEPDSRLADLFGGTQVAVNSMHHQAVRDLGRGFLAVAHAPDGVVEGIERPDHPFAVAVQFHPEELVPGHVPSERLLQRFVEASR